jgi:hypothetical protein
MACRHYLPATARFIASPEDLIDNEVRLCKNNSSTPYHPTRLPRPRRHDPPSPKPGPSVLTTWFVCLRDAISFAPMPPACVASQEQVRRRGEGDSIAICL